MLDGTDRITQAAKKKRESKVGPGAFHDSNLQYFGDTVVIWDVKEFMANPKWREDAMRRSRNRKDVDSMKLVDLGAVAGKKKRKRRGGDEEAQGVAAGKKGGEAKGGGKKKPSSRKKRFEAICDRLYQQSLSRK